jgi:hypothetical protein
LRAAEAADDGERELFQLDRQVDPYETYVFREREGDGGEIEDPLDADRDQSVRYPLGGGGWDGDHRQPDAVGLGQF